MFGAKVIRNLIATALALSLIPFTACSKSYLAEYTFDGTCEFEGSESVPATAALESSPGSSECVANGMRFSWQINNYGIRLNIANETASPIDIRWAGVTFFGDTSESSDVITTAEPIGGRSIDRTTIPAAEMVSLWLYPRAYMEEREGRWFHTRTMFDPPGVLVGRTREEIIAIATPAIGKSLAFELPVKVDGRRLTYTFKLKLISVDGRRRFLS